ncbi:MAG: hypothetical protein DLM65_00905 [Candidatus Aeolococcus gillhamiae]|uniref:Uncharacterized protein n=1 Tax=Candidatus Aeolococcus gillhamiae TaxID=3127015 RepID=A0A2W5ZEU6_9BACT|nr:MAG: hypothetical protein DLM65_00905 [Candidatus Dormibacter sp. RRmetagenome_bin12]
MPPISLPDLAPLAGLLVLLELAVGTVAVSAALDQVGRVGRGFAGTTAAICALIMGADLLLISGSSDLGGLLHARVDSASVANFVHWAVAFAALLAGDAVFAAVGTEISRRVVTAATAAVGVVTIVTAALAIGPALGGAGAATLAFLSAALLAGSALAGMLLGHWYLVTPNMSFRPLRLSIYAVFGAVAVECAVIATALLGAGGSRERLLSGDQAFLFWLLVIGSGVLFTAAVNAFTLYFARIRANQPATAMLYVLIISVVMGLVPAHLVYLVTRVAI